MLFFINSTAKAAEKDFCTDYVLISIKQYWRSINYDCGFNGKRWNADYKGQYHWCLSAYSWVADKEVREREHLLQTCIVKAKVVSPLSFSLSINEELLRAVAENNIDKVKQLVKKGANIDFKTRDIALIKELGMRYQINTGNELASNVFSDVNKRITGKKGRHVPVAESALSLAVSKGLVEIGLWLLDQHKKTLPEKRRQQYKSSLLGNALIMAVKQEKTELVRDLLNKGADVNYEFDGNSGTPLYFSVLQGSQDIMRLLLEKQANPNYVTNAGESMLNKVIDNPALLELLLQYNADPNSNGEAVDKTLLPIMQAVEKNNVQAVDLLMEYGATAEVYGYSVTSPLITAIKREQIAMIRVLLKHDVNMNIVDNKTSPGHCVQGEKNSSPFSVAAETKNRHVMSLLVNAKSIDVLCPVVEQ